MERRHKCAFRAHLPSIRQAHVIRRAHRPCRLTREAERTSTLHCPRFSTRDTLEGWRAGWLAWQGTSSLFCRHLSSPRTLSGGIFEQRDENNLPRRQGLWQSRTS
ncbi:hypothetical protein BD626DRAFT_627412 [Schizophyllum amplum]|uniref:Uncharacterized protein n=1 Tax=Schizophyllum amplum TaxID=97359 RepID=A0A550CQ82_9AGAR|nr:hypothetical protein BD626DRAFT_627412 [Auriculariopsis ampla]